jgi:hypothetical protein
MTELARAEQQSRQAGSSVKTANTNISATESAKAEAKANMDNLAREDYRYEQICHTIEMQKSVVDETSYGRTASDTAAI